MDRGWLWWGTVPARAAGYLGPHHRIPLDNPFFHRGPIDDPAAVFGRGTEIERALRVLEPSPRGAWVELTGPHRIGKSTVLLAVERALRSRLPDVVVGRLSAQSTEDTPDFWRRACIALGGPRDVAPTKHALETCLHTLDEAGRRAVLLVDELPVLAQEGRDPDVFGQLRGLGEDLPLALVTVSPRRMFAFVRPREGVSPPWANAHEVAVGTFPETVAKAFLAERGRARPFTEAEAGEIFTLAGGSPWRITVAAFHCWAARAAGHGEWRGAYERERANEPRETTVGPAPGSLPYDPGGSDEIRVFISSPIAGVVEERAAVKRACVTLGLVAVMAEDFGARDGTSRQVCLGELARCQVLVLLMPGRYGPPTELGVSATQEEVEAAGRLGVPRLVYVAEPGASGNGWFSWMAPKPRDPRQHDWIHALTGSFGEGLYRETYRAPADLEQRARDDLWKLVRRRARWALDRERR